MSPLVNFLIPVLALLITTLIFLITILLAFKRWIGFYMTLLLLFLSLTTGLAINYQRDLQHYFTSFSQPASESPESFHAQMLQAMENLKLEITTEKENLHRIISQIQEIFNSMDIQKQKLQFFIEEAREHFNSDYSTPSSNIEKSPSFSAHESEHFDEKI